MVIELSLGGLLTLLGIPTAITSLGLWILQRKMAKREEIRDKREAAREKNEVLLIQNTRAALALAEATAIAVQRIPDAHCNGDMHAALEYARQGETRTKGLFDGAGRQGHLLRAAMKLFLLALLGIVELLRADQKGGP